MAKKKIDPNEYKIGNIYKISAFIAAGLNPIRHEKSIALGKEGIRVIFVFARKEAEEMELRYINGDLPVDARRYSDTINDIHSIIKNTLSNVVYK